MSIRIPVDIDHTAVKPDGSKDVHVYPTYGKEHEMSRSCWCAPFEAPGAQLIVLHRAQS